MMRNARGFTLAETIISIGISTIAILGFASLISLGVQHFHANVEQSNAEESLSSAAYYLKFFMSQAVKVKCCRGASCQVPAGPMAPIPFPSYNMPVTPDEPQLVAEGRIDCRDGAPLMWVPATENALGVFIRDIGKATSTFSAASQYRSTAIYFVPASTTSPNSREGINSGMLRIYDADPGGAYTLVQQFSQLVDIKVVPGSTEVAPNDSVSAISYKLRARYFGPFMGNTLDYRENATPTDQFFDTETMVKIVFRNNRIGESTVNGLTSERPLGQMYFFRFFAPAAGLML